MSKIESVAEAGARIFALGKGDTLRNAGGELPRDTSNPYYDFLGYCTALAAEQGRSDLAAALDDALSAMVTYYDRSPVDFRNRPWDTEKVRCISIGDYNPALLRPQAHLLPHHSLVPPHPIKHYKKSRRVLWHSPGRYNAIWELNCAISLSRLLIYSPGICSMPSFRNAMVCSAAATPALKLASAVCAPIFLGVKNYAGGEFLFELLGTIRLDVRNIAKVGTLFERLDESLFVNNFLCGRY